MTPLQFESGYGALWDELDASLARIEGKRRPGKAAAKRSATQEPLDAARVAALYRATCEHLALARSRDYPIHLTDRLEDLTQRAHQVVYQRRDHGMAQFARLFLVDFPQACRAHRLYMGSRRWCSSCRCSCWAC